MLSVLVVERLSHDILHSGNYIEEDTAFYKVWSWRPLAAASLPGNESGQVSRRDTTILLFDYPSGCFALLQQSLLVLCQSVDIIVSLAEGDNVVRDYDFARLVSIFSLCEHSPFPLPTEWSFSHIYQYGLPTDTADRGSYQFAVSSQVS